MWFQLGHYREIQFDAGTAALGSIVKKKWFNLQFAMHDVRQRRKSERERTNAKYATVCLCEKVAPKADTLLIWSFQQKFQQY